jgi:sugar lactone lactonase YvrE
MIFGGGIVALIAFTLLLIQLTVNVERSVGIGLVPGVTVREFAILPDSDAYPPALAVAPDGSVYTGSFATGAVWLIGADQAVSEIPFTRDQIGSVVGLAVAPDGSLLVIDALDTDPRTAGGRVWRVTSAGDVTGFAAIDDARGFVSPDDVTLDRLGNVYVSDRGRNEVWKFAPDGSNGLPWWWPVRDADTRQRAITGLAYDPFQDAIIVTDPEVNEIYRVYASDSRSEIVYTHGDRPNPPGFDGVTVTPDGTIFVAALGQNGIARVQDGDLDYIAGLFRGASDVAYGQGRLYVANFDQTSLVIPVYSPSLPFAVDVIEFGSEYLSSSG